MRGIVGGGERQEVQRWQGAGSSSLPLHHLVLDFKIRGFPSKVKWEKKPILE